MNTRLNSLHSFAYDLPNFYSLSLVICLLNVSTVAAQESDLRSTSHPIIGYWEATDQNTGCKESYQFNPDGKGIFTSGQETLEVVYEVTPQPNLYGFFKLQHTAVSSNQEKDCTQSQSALNEKQISYILFQPEGYSFIACDNEDASLETCFGPMILKGKTAPSK